MLKIFINTQQEFILFPRSLIFHLIVLFYPNSKNEKKMIKVMSMVVFYNSFKMANICIFLL